MKLENRIALVTGAGRGIGRAVAVKLAAEGADVVINDLDEAPLSETAAAVRSLGRQVVAVPGDVTEAAFADSFVAAALGRFERLDIIINNAGFTWDNVIQKMSDEQWQTIIDVHLTAPFRILRAAAPYIRDAAKRERAAATPVYRKVVNVSSTSGLYGNAGQANYSSAKAGIIGLTRAMAREWGRYNVNINCVAPGLIETRLSQPLGGESASIEVAGRTVAVGIQSATLASVEQMIPLGRQGTPEEAAGAICLFCFPESNYVSGQVITCAGGAW